MNKPGAAKGMNFRDSLAAANAMHNAIYCLRSGDDAGLSDDFWETAQDNEPHSQRFRAAIQLARAGLTDEPLAILRDWRYDLTPYFVSHFGEDAVAKSVSNLFGSHLPFDISHNAVSGEQTLLQAFLLDEPDLVNNLII